MKLIPVILSGGLGTRLWPLSRSLYPKQLHALVTDDTMLQATVHRVADIEGIGAPLLVAGEELRFMVANQMVEIGYNDSRIILEPEGRNTAPAIALAAFTLIRDDPDSVMLVMPSDHLIRDCGTFCEAVSRSYPVVLDKHVHVTFGITPQKPETGYGYIRYDKPLDENYQDIYRLKQFVEKPDEDSAQTLLEAGDAVWNSGIFMMHCQTYLEELEQMAPDIYAACREASNTAQSDGRFIRPNREAFIQAPAISVDYAVMEKTSRAAVMPVQMGWSDIGSWDGLWQESAKDDHGNSLTGHVVIEDVHDSLIHSDNQTVAVVGVDDLVVVSTRDVLLVTTRSHAHHIRSVVGQLKQQNHHSVYHHTIVHRPWGSYQTTDKGERFQTKRIIVSPGEKLSLQKHLHRSEHWIIVQGTALVTCGDEEMLVHENESVYIPKGVVHRLENPGKIPLQLIEVQSGAYFGEDDIVRQEDFYGRAQGQN